MIFRIKPLIIGIVSVIVLVVIIFAATQKPAPNEGVSPAPSTDESRLSALPPTPATTPGTPPPSSPVAKPAPAPTPVPSGGDGPTPTPSTAKPLPDFVAPAPGEKLVFSKSNVIQWSEEVGFAGEVYLLNADPDLSVAGWILTETGIHQTSYTWNTRDVYVSKTNPSKKTIAPGGYIIEVTFNTNPKIKIRSFPFWIIYENEVYIPTYALTIKNYALLFPSLTVKKGDKITFTNGDPVTHTLNLASYSPFVIQPGASFTFDTRSLTQGSYNFYSTTYPTLKLTVTVQ